MDLLRELKAMPVTLHLLQVSSSSPGLGWFQRQQFQEQGSLYDSHKAWLAQTIVLRRGFLILVIGEVGGGALGSK